MKISNFKLIHLHIPKTAGQAIYFSIKKIIGEKYTSPIRVYTQSIGRTNFPDKYNFYSGHLNWGDINKFKQKKKFIFTILRDPKERIASFYFYLKNKAKLMTSEELLKKNNNGLKKIIDYSIDDYFFSGSDEWKNFILNHYDNVYLYYLGTCSFEKRHIFKNIEIKERINRTINNIRSINKIYSNKALSKLDNDLFEFLKIKTDIHNTFVNVNKGMFDISLYNDFINLFEKDGSVKMIRNFVDQDYQLIHHLKKQNLFIEN